MFSTIEVDQPGDGIARITLNRPSNANSLNGALIDDLAAAVSAVDARVLVITGAGRFFCAGADLKELGGDADWIWKVRATFEAIETLPFPSIAAINGASMGGGTELALACDLRIANRGVKIGLPEIRFGALPAAGGPNRLARVVGRSAAKRLVMTGSHIMADEAAALGLVDEVVDELDARVLELAGVISARAAYAVRTAKAIIDSGAALPLSEALQAEYRAIDAMASDEERQVEVARAMENDPTYDKIFSRTSGASRG